MRKEVLHEVNSTSHRIIFINEDKTSEAGEWAPLAAVASLSDHFAIVGESPLPQGVFTCREVPASLI